MNKIDISKKYRTRSKLPVEILRTDIKSTDFPVVAIIQLSDDKEFSDCFTEYGKLYAHGESDMDLIEMCPYEDFKIDEPVMVRSASSDSWMRRYFAGVDENGKALTWAHGGTSWSSHTSKFNYTEWTECRRPTPEELA